MKLSGLCWASILIFLMATNQSVAAVLEIELFGHRILILGDVEQSLSIDDKKVHTNSILSLKTVTLVGGIPVVVGHSSPGGNSCEGTPFVISFPTGKSPRFDGPIETCFPVKTEILADKIRFSTTPLPSADGEVWEWAVVEGIKKVGQVKLTASSSKGWNELRERTIEHPSDLFEYGEISAQLDALLGADKERFTQIIVGVGSGEFKNDTYIGRTCASHSCGTIEALVIADIPSKQVFLAWKDSDSSIIVRPKVAKWNDKFRAELREWASKWK